MLILPSILLLLSAPNQGAHPEPQSEHTEIRAWADKQKQAKVLHQQRRFSQSARIFEQLWAEYQRSFHLYNAAVSRLAAGHYAHAIHQFEVYLNLPGVSRANRELAAQQIERARLHARPVTIGVVGAVERGAVELVVRPANHSETDSRGPFAITNRVGKSGELTAVQRQVWLEPGSWTIQLRERGLQPVLKKIDVPETDKVLIQLESTAPDERPLDILGYTLVGVGGVATAAGAISIGITTLRHNRAQVHNSEECKVVGSETETDKNSELDESDQLKFIDRESCEAYQKSARDSYYGATNGRGVGANIFGIGVGVLISGGVSFARTRRARRIAWASLLATGAGASVAGVILSRSAAASLHMDLDKVQGKEKDEDLTKQYSDVNFSNPNKLAALHTSSSALLGLGIGLTVGSTAGLIRNAVAAKQPRVSFTPVFSTSQAGVSLSGRF